MEVLIYRKSIYKWRTFRCHCWVPKGMFMIVGRGTYPSPDVSSWRMKIPWCLWHSAILVVMSYRRCRSSILFSLLLTQWLDEPTIVGGNPAGTRCQNQRGLNSMWAVASTAMAMGEISNHQRLVCTEFACFIPICVYVNICKPCKLYLLHLWSLIRRYTKMHTYRTRRILPVTSTSAWGASSSKPSSSMILVIQ